MAGGVYGEDAEVNSNWESEWERVERLRVNKFKKIENKWGSILLPCFTQSEVKLQILLAE
jgi:hypothetical protein